MNWEENNLYIVRRATDLLHVLSMPHTTIVKHYLPMFPHIRNTGTGQSEEDRGSSKFELSDRVKEVGQWESFFILWSKHSVFRRKMKFRLTTQQPTRRRTRQ